MSGKRKENNEKLINLVRECSFLYDLRHPDYKDMAKKAQAWKDIAERLHQNIDTVKIKWKNLRDSYVKYLKYLRGAAGSEKKYKNWPWAAHLDFLKDSVTSRLTVSYVPESSKTGAVQVDEDINDGSSVTNDGGSVVNGGSFVANDDSLMPPPRKRAKSEEVVGDFENFSCYLLNKKDNKRTSHLDHTDNLFLSYADTFKRLSPRSQVVIKMEMAQMFARAELRDMDSKTTP